MPSLRSIFRKALHRTVHRFGFRLVRAPAFERAIRNWELDHQPFYFVQVGAHNGITSDPFHRFLIENLAWESILIEPQGPCINTLRSIYADRENIRIEHAAIGPAKPSGVDSDSAPRTLTIYKVSDAAVGLPHWANQLASPRREVVASHVDRIPDIERWIEAHEVPCKGLAEIVGKHRFPRVDLLASDTEGFDFEIVKQIDSLPSLPQFIYYEHLHLGAEQYAQSLRFLQDRGYQTIAVNNGDTFAYRSLGQSPNESVTIHRHCDHLE
jgi:FkbM family methyltransferase